MAMNKTSHGQHVDRVTALRCLFLPIQIRQFVLLDLNIWADGNLNRPWKTSQPSMLSFRFCLDSSMISVLFLLSWFDHLVNSLWSLQGTLPLFGGFMFVAWGLGRFWLNSRCPGIVSDMLDNDTGGNGIGSCNTASQQTLLSMSLKPLSSGGQVEWNFDAEEDSSHSPFFGWA